MFFLHDFKDHLSRDSTADILRLKEAVTAVCGGIPTRHVPGDASNASIHWMKNGAMRLELDSLHLHIDAPVYRDNLSGDIGCLPGAQKTDNSCNFLRGAKAA